MGAVYDHKVAAEARKLATEHLDNALLTNPPKLNVGGLFERKDDPRYTLYCGVDMAAAKPFKDATAVVVARKVRATGVIEIEQCRFIESLSSDEYCRWRRRIRFLMQAQPVRRSQRRAGPAHPWRWPGSRAKR